jgi:putative holliday junction resolvase
MAKTGRIMAFDYGLKRTGIAVSDETRVFSFPLVTVETPKLMEWLVTYAGKETVSQFVVGLPLHADQTPAAIEPHIAGFVTRLKKSFPSIPVDRMDERYTSKMAFDTILAAGVPKMKRRNKSLIDKISASIILQSYIDSLKNNE